jgi:hypothetical protein
MYSIYTPLRNAGYVNTKEIARVFLRYSARLSEMWEIA